MLMSTIKNINLPLDEDPQTGWRPYPLFNGATRCMDSFSSHVSVLSPSVMPHQPHKHLEEELLILLSGEADIVVPDGLSNQGEIVKRIRPGFFVYYPAFKAHTIHSAGTQPATYLMFKWHKEGASEKETPLDSTLVYYIDSIKNIDSERSGGIIYRGILEGQTEYLQKLQCHITVLRPGSGYQPHSDAYDVAILLLNGMVETLDQKVGPHGVIFYTAGEPHGIRNIGGTTAVYLVFEFHGMLKDLYVQNAMLRAQLQKINEGKDTFLLKFRQHFKI